MIPRKLLSPSLSFIYSRNSCLSIQPPDIEQVKQAQIVTFLTYVVGARLTLWTRETAVGSRCRRGYNLGGIGVGFWEEANDFSLISTIQRVQTGCEGIPPG
jgi:hypothetical protein